MELIGMEREGQPSEKVSESQDIIIKGLENLGNTCYMNCCVQALYASVEFREYLYSGNWSSKPLHNSLKKLFKQIDFNDSTKSIEPKGFWNTFVEFKPQFRGRQQHDAQECLRYVIDGVHEEANKAIDRRNKRDRKVSKVVNSGEKAWKQFIKYVDESYLTYIFVGQLKTTIECTECHNKRDSWEQFWDISLSLPEDEKESDVCRCLQLFIDDEVLDSDSMPDCSNCNQKRKSVKSSKFDRMPLILLIQLKEFGNDGQKIHKEIKINENLKVNDIEYCLFVCISHRGYNSNGGHYICHCKHSDKWYFFDDEDVTEVDNFDVSKLIDAYILFYRRVDYTIKLL